MTSPLPPAGVRILGDGPPIAVVPGGPGFSHDYLHAALDPLSGSFMLVYVDPSGWSGSRPLDAGDGPLLARWAEDLDGVRTALGLEDWHLLAHSVGGGAIAIESARRRPESVRSLVLCSAAADASFAAALGERIAEVATPAQLAALGEAFTEPAQSDEAFASRVATLLPLYFSPGREGLADVSDLRLRCAAAPFDAFKRTVLPDFDVRPVLPELAVRALIVGGSNDRIAPIDLSSRPLLAIPRSQLVEIDSGHLPFVERPDEFRALLADWVRDIEAARLAPPGPPSG